MTPENADRLGRLVDKLDNALTSAKSLPLPAQTHKDILVTIMREARDIAADIVRKETGDDPWEDNPLEG